MKKLLSLFIIWSFLSCSESIYYGYVYDGISKQPLSNVKVMDLKYGFKSVTNKEGYYQIEKVKNSSSKLIFERDLYYTDTINSIQIQNGEKQTEIFKGGSIFLFCKSPAKSRPFRYIT